MPPTLVEADEEFCRIHAHVVLLQIVPLPPLLDLAEACTCMCHFLDTGPGNQPQAYLSLCRIRTVLTGVDGFGLDRRLGTRVAYQISINGSKPLGRFHNHVLIQVLRC